VNEIVISNVIFRRLCHGAIGLLLAMQMSFVGAVDFEFHDLDGNAQSLEKYRGQWVLVNYWATWCVSCLDEIPELNRFHHQQGSSVLGINVEALDSDSLRFFSREQSIEYPLLITPPGGQTVFGNVSVLPTSYLVSPAGDVVAKHVGKITETMLEEFIKRYR